MSTVFDFAAGSPIPDVIIPTSYQPTECQQRIIAQALHNFDEAAPLRPLPSFEMRARSKHGRAFSVLDTAKQCSDVEDKERKRKPGAGRKAASIENTWFLILKDECRDVIHIALSDLLHGLVSLSDNNTRGVASPAVLVSVLSELELITVKSIMETYRYSKSQASKIFNLVKCALALPFDVIQKIEEAKQVKNASRLDRRLFTLQ